MNTTANQFISSLDRSKSVISQVLKFSAENFSTLLEADGGYLSFKDGSAFEYTDSGANIVEPRCY